MSAEDFVVFKAGALAIWFAALFLGERIRPAAPPPTTRLRIFVNGALWLIVLVISPLIVLPLTAFAAEHPLWRRGPAFDAWPVLAGELVLLDLWTYWLHRAYHELPLMWRLHAPHHFDASLDTTTAVRFHAGEVALSAALRMAPIVVLAIPFAHVVVFETLLLGTAMFHHSNIRLPPNFEAALSRIIVTPSIHWVHHHAVWRDTNSNYSGIFSLWDPLFGTRSPRRRTQDMKIGVQDGGERPFLRLLLTPFANVAGPSRTET
jgi:sterol desaturase/sphingolipid hydroxylase (fatty acid hydroxylase superfamily)